MAKRSVTHSLGTPLGRVRAWLHFYLKDHQFIRMWWWNLDEVAPGVWRSNQPSPWRLRHLTGRLGLATVVSLRGDQPQSFNLLEARACADLGVTFTHLNGVEARGLVPAAQMLRIVDGIAAQPKPVLFHCKSGADRTGLIACLYLILIERRDVAATAAEHLRPGRIHFRRTRSGVLDHLFRVYLRDGAGLDFRHWLETAYDPAAIAADFEDWRNKTGRWSQ